MAHPKTTAGFEIEARDTGVIIRKPGNGEVHYLNATAGIVYMSCDGNTSTQDIANLLSAHFSLDEPPVADVQTVLRDLHGKGLILVPDEPAEANQTSS